MTAPSYRLAATLLLTLAASACAPRADRPGSATVAGEAPRPASAAADTLPSELQALWPEEMPPGDGPLTPFADSAAGLTRWGFRAADGRVLVPATYHYATPMFEGRAAVANAGGYSPSRWGYVNARGEVVIPFSFDGAGPFADGRAPVMRGDDFMLVDSTGAVVEQLASASSGDAAAPALPAPCDGCRLGEYARRLPRSGGPMQVYVQPVEAESLRRIAIVRHPGGWLSVAESGWEHWADELRLPGVPREAAEALARRLMGAGQYTESRDARDGDALVLLEAGAHVETGNEEMRVRVRRGVVEIVHSDGI